MLNTLVGLVLQLELHIVRRVLVVNGVLPVV